MEAIDSLAPLENSEYGILLESSADILLFRFQTPNLNEGSLAHYFQLNFGMYPFSIPGSKIGSSDIISPNDARSTLSNINWSADTAGDLILCQRGYLFNG